MGSLNRVQLIGNLGRDPELRYTPDGTPVCNFTLATTEQWSTKAGEKQEKTEWHRISLWGKVAEISAQYLKKGRQVYIEGSLRSREYTDKEGQKKTSVEIRGDRMVMLGRAGDGAGGGEGGQPSEGGGYAKRAPAPRPSAARESGGAGGAGEPPTEPDFNDDDIPF